ncbi:MAG: NADH:ubiquinone oxidoreductase [Candidatus Woesearchaeota archaeon]
MTVKKKVRSKKPVLGIVSFTCDEGCQFAILFIEGIFDLLDKFDVQYFHLLKEKNREAKFDLMFVEGAISTKKQVKKLKKIRKDSKFLVALGACACHGGVPAMRNFIDNKELGKYVWNQRMLKDSIPASGIEKYVKVDYYLYGCPVIKKEFVGFLEGFLKGKIPEQKTTPVCSECPRQGKPECFLRQRVECLGPVSRAGCEAICPKNNVPCMLCRGPLPAANVAGEVALFKSFGLDEKAIKDRIRMFKNIELK